MISLALPPKRAVLAHLDIPLATGETVKDEDRVPIIRKAEVDVSRAHFLFGARGCRVTYTDSISRFDPTYRADHVARLWVRRPLVITSPGGSPIKA